MSAYGMLSRFSLGQIRTLGITSAGGQKSSLCALAKHPEGRKKVWSASFPYQIRGKEVSRFYSAGELAQNPGNMRIAIIGQSMFGQEVCSYLQGMIFSLNTVT